MYRGGRRERQRQRLEFFHVSLGTPPCQKQTKIWPQWDFLVKSDTDEAQVLIQEALANSSLCQGISIKLRMVSTWQSMYYLDHRVAHIDWWLRFLLVHGLKAAFWSVKMNTVVFYWIFRLRVNDRGVWPLSTAYLRTQDALSEALRL